MFRREFVGLLAAAAPAWCEGPPIRVQLTTGGHAHDISFYSVFEGNASLRINVNPHPSAFRRDLRASADVLVLYDMVDLEGEKERANLQAFVEAGKGLVVLHHSLCGNWRWKWWYEEVVGGRYLMDEDAGLKKSAFKHDVEIAVKPVASHPVLKGIGAFTVFDETYKGMWISPRSQVLLETDHPDGDRAVAWIGPNAKSRVAVIQLGHGPEAHRHPVYRRLVSNAIQWAAGR